MNANAAVDAAIGGTTPPPGGNEVEPNNTRAHLAARLDRQHHDQRHDVEQQRHGLLPHDAGRRAATLTATLAPNASSDYDLFVYNSNGVLIGRSERGTGLVDTVTVTNTGTSAFMRYVRVVYWSGGTGATNGKYTLNMNW